MAISLVKGQSISLEKTTGVKLSSVAMGLGWDIKKAKGLFGMFSGGGDIDLDASCLLFGANGNLIDQVWFQQLISQDGSIRHSGDNRSGAGSGDDETITVNLSNLPASVMTLVFTVNSFTGENFSRVENAYCRLIDTNTKKEVAKYNLSSAGDYTGQIMAKLSRVTGEWVMTAIGESSNGRTFRDMHPNIARHL